MTDYSDKTPGNTPIVCVDWSDIVGPEEWNDEGGGQIWDFVAVGWLLEDSEKQIVIAGFYSHDTQEWKSKHAFPKLPPQIIAVRDQTGLMDDKEADD